ncbi:MAG: hypothetical protein K0S74_1322 [Chlamydiales bacterium]|jgi:hypothetical protein|nr:hypothetical protein [Chlamydiales bacterium]
MSTIQTLPHDIWHTICHFLDDHSFQSLRQANKEICHKIEISLLKILKIKIENLRNEAFKWTENFNKYFPLSFDHYVQEFNFKSDQEVSTTNSGLMAKLKRMKDSIVKGEALTYGSHQIDSISEEFLDIEKFYAFKLNSSHSYLGTWLVLHDTGDIKSQWFEWSETGRVAFCKKKELAMQYLPLIYPYKLLQNIKEGNTIGFPLNRKLLLITCKQTDGCKIHNTAPLFEDVVSNILGPMNIDSQNYMYFPLKDNFKA